MITRIKIERFKSIESFELILHGVDVLIGGNNAGKSSALQALQFAASLLQTMALESSMQYDDNPKSKSLSPERIIYSPISNVYALLHGNEPLREGSGCDMSIELEEKNGNNINKGQIIIKKGRNKNIVVSYSGKELCQKMANLNPVFSMYVPGLAGIPFYEEYRSIGAVRRAAARGDCNTVLRNVLYNLSIDTEKYKNFLNDLNSIFPDVSIKINPRLENDGMIEVLVDNSKYTKPIDATGTGVLQAIQICAYMNYFEPQLLLLDEPDSHLHPNNQKMLAQMILQLAQKNRNIIISTHSRHLVGALRKNAQVTLLKNGTSQPHNYSEYDILMEIGALDEYDVYRDPNIKYVIATEDACPNSHKLLSLILQCSGFDTKSFVILPYEGCSKIDSAIYVSKCLKHFREDLRIIIHRDRDGMTKDEVTNFINKIEQEKNLHCFVTHYNDLEMYFCSPEHIQKILADQGIRIDLDKVQNIVDKATEHARTQSLEKYLNRRLDPMRTGGRGTESIEASNYFNDNLQYCLNGHIMIGFIKSILHQEYHVKEGELIKLTEFIGDDTLRKIITSPTHTKNSTPQCLTE